MDQLLYDDLETRRTAGTYGKFERGLLDNPTPEYLRGVGHILHFNSQQWHHLFAFARGELPPFALFGDAAIAVSDHWARDWKAFEPIEHLCDYAGNVLRFSPSFAAIFPQQRVPVNFYHYVLFDDHARNRLFPDWETTWGPMTVALVRAALAQHRHNGMLRTLARQVRADPRTRSLISTIPCRHSAEADERALAHPELGVGWVDVSEPLSSPGAHVFQHTWLYRAPQQPRVQAALLELGDRDPCGFFPSPVGERWHRPEAVIVPDASQLPERVRAC